MKLKNLDHHVRHRVLFLGSSSWRDCYLHLLHLFAVTTLRIESLNFEIEIIFDHGGI